MFLAGCGPPAESSVKAILGAVLIDGSGGPPVSDSIVVVSGSRILAVGPRASIPIPQGSDNISGAGKFIIPAWADVRSRTVPLRAGQPEAVRRQVAGLDRQHADAVEISSLPPAVMDAVFDESRKFHIPVLAAVATLAQAARLVDDGVGGFFGMIRDTRDIDSAFVAKLRDLQIVFVPGLAGADSEIARHNTRRLAAAGVPIAVAGPDLYREMEALAGAGLSPSEVLIAATRNGALALGRLAEGGTLEAGKRADLMVLAANPLEDIRNARRVERVMRAGQWTER